MLYQGSFSAMAIFSCRQPSILEDNSAPCSLTFYGRQAAVHSPAFPVLRPSGLCPHPLPLCSYARRPMPFCPKLVFSKRPIAPGV